MKQGFHPCLVHFNRHMCTCIDPNAAKFASVNHETFNWQRKRHMHFKCRKIWFSQTWSNQKHSTHKGNVTCTFLCLHKFEPYLYSLSQTWHLNGFSSKWLRRCLLISCFVENGLWQIPQAWRFSPWTSENKFHFSQLMQRNYTYNTNDLKEHFAHLYDVACGHSNWAKASISHRFHTV